METLQRDKWEKVVEFNCGCSATFDEETEGTYYMSNFCEEHDPSIKRD